MSDILDDAAPPRWAYRLSRLIEYSSLIGVACLPAIATWYLSNHGDQQARFHAHSFHEIAIVASTILGLFIAEMTRRCYVASGERLLAHLFVGLLGFTLVYAPHGVLTRLWSHELELFLVFGPLSRCVLAASMLFGAVSWVKSHETKNRKIAISVWVAAFIAVDIIVTALWLSLAIGATTRIAIESAAILLNAMAATTLLLGRRKLTPMLTIYLLAIFWMIQSSVTFLTSQAWNHIWWAAHAYFAGAFFMLAYGVSRAILSTKSFSGIYDVEEWVRRLSDAYKKQESEIRMRIKAEKAAEKEARKLSLANAELEHFTYAVSHDLQSPLRTVSGLTALARRRLVSEANDTSIKSAVEDLKLVENAAKQMSQMIRDLLDLSRANRKDTDCTFEMASVVSEVMILLNQDIKQCDAKIELGDLPEIFHSKEHVKSIFLNLIGNALKYRSERRPPLIRVSAEKNSSDWEIAVEDNGRGVPESDRSRVFDLFSRLHRPEDAAGTGIGLALCRKIVESRGGKIWIADGIDGGCAVRFTCPTPLAH